LTGLFGKGSKNEKTKYLRSKKSDLKKLVKDKKYDKVLKVGSEILEKNPHDLDVLFVLGGLHYMKGKFSKAISFFDKVLEISEFDPETLLLKANSHYKLGQYKKSFTCCEKIKEIDPKNKGVSELLSKIPKNSDN
jgi:tetratricopeptide (TPR) repeat protein